MLHWSVYDHPLSRDGVHLLWNIRTDQLIRLSDAERQAFLRSETPELTGERLAQLSRGGFLTECADEPAEVMRSLMRMRRLLTPHFRILLTTACNARCAYCYQQDAPVMRMTAETARETAAFIVQQARECQSQRAMLEWFGGEPTLEARTAEIICRKLQESGLSFASSLVTNGLLLDSTFLPLREALCLKHVQITLDGMEGEHERIKGFPPGSFQRVIRSAEQCLREGLRVTLRLNMAQDAQALVPLLDALAERFSPLPDGLAIRLAPLYKPCKEIPAAVMREVLKAQELIRVRGLSRAPLPGKLHTRMGCFACSPGGFTIRPDGRLLHCSHDLSDASSHGTVSSFRADDPLRRLFLQNGLHGECRSCPFLPVCGGGCAAAAVLTLPMHRCFALKTVLAEVLWRRYAEDA